jgi:hypothetical protein
VTESLAVPDARTSGELSRLAGLRRSPRRAPHARPPERTEVDGEPRRPELDYGAVDLAVGEGPGGRGRRCVGRRGRCRRPRV